MSDNKDNKNNKMSGSSLSKIDIDSDGICLYVDISRNIGYRKHGRSDRHCDYGNVVMIENLLCYSNRFKRGDFWLYKEDNIVCESIFVE